MIVYGFTTWTQDKSSDDLLISKESYEKIANFSPLKFEEFVSKISDENKISFFDKYLSIDSFKARFDDKSMFLANNYGIKLISQNIYNDYFEKLINKEWNAIKNVNKNEDVMFLRWNYNSITEYSLSFNPRIYKDFNQNLVDKNYTNENIIKNSLEVIKIEAKHRVYLKPFYTGNDQFWLNMYDKYYKNSGFIFANLTPYAINLEKELNTKITMESGTHPSNSGGLIESIAIAQWINDFYKNID